MKRHALGAVLVALMGGLTCAEEQPVPGHAAVWLSSTEALPLRPDLREVIDVSGVVGAVAAGPAKPAADHHSIFVPQYVWAIQVLTIVDDAGIEWRLGIEIRYGSPRREATPPLSSSLVGKRVRLLFRQQFWPFGAAAGFVLSDDAGLVLAMDLADFVTALRSDDVPGLAVEDGSGVGVERLGNDGSCFDQEYRTLIFKADAAVQVSPAAGADVMIRGTRYVAHNIRNTRAVGMNLCHDVPTSHRLWAITRAP